MIRAQLSFKINNQMGLLNYNLIVNLGIPKFIKNTKFVELTIVASHYEVN